MSWKRLRGAFLITGAIFGAPDPAVAQHEHDESAIRLRFGGQAIGVLSHVTPAILGRDLTEGYLTQPTVMGHASVLDGRLAIQAVLNLEGATLRRGELNAGIWGEGYVDRRHPHTYLHEWVGVAQHQFGALGASVTLGKGFAPFGTDDPMVRGFVKYPANHHFSQVLERLVAIAAVRYRPLVIEVGTFNGDEPLSPRSNGTLDRVGDSWSVRGTLTPVPGLELQASRAELESPEQPSGGLDHRKRSVSGRFERQASRFPVYALVEYARTSYVDAGRETFAFTSYLGESSIAWNRWGLGVRYEVTVRPEEERLLDPFRSARPPTDFSILGRTRWKIATLQLSHEWRQPYGAITPLIEVGRGSAEVVNKPAVYEPENFYGDDVLWTFSFGLRLTAGTRHLRMGRYGVAQHVHELAVTSRN